MSLLSLRDGDGARGDRGKVSWRNPLLLYARLDPDWAYEDATLDLFLLKKYPYIDRLRARLAPTMPRYNSRLDQIAVMA